MKCKICDTDFSNLRLFSIHLKTHDITGEDYYKSFIDSNAGTCCICGSRTKFLSITHGFRRYCGSKCSANDPAVHAKAQETCKQRHGYATPFQNKEIQAAIAQKHRDKNEDEKLNEKIKRETTMHERYGVKYAIQSDEFKKKRENTCLSKYGQRSISQLDDVKKRKQETLMKNYGFASAMNPCTVEKYHTTLHDNYGVKWPMQSYDIRSKSRTKIKHDDLYFDSSWELAYYLYLKENEIDFVYHPNVYFEYMGEDNKSHKYWPDFYVNNEYVEIKSSYLLNNKHPSYSQAKINCIVEHANIITYNELKEILKEYKYKYKDLFEKDEI